MLLAVLLRGCPEADAERGLADTCTVASVPNARVKVSWRSFCFR